MIATATKPKRERKPKTAARPAPPTPMTPGPAKEPERRADGLPVKLIDPHPFNARTEIVDAELDQLAASLRDHGLLQPIVVREAPKGRYQLIAGERRLRAAERAGWPNVPAIVRAATDGEALIMGLVENIQRRDLNAIEKARGLARLCAPVKDGGCGLTQAQAAGMFGHVKNWASRLVGLLELPDVWQQRIVSGELSERQARALVPYADRPAVLARIEDDMRANPWSWRSQEDFERNAALLAETADTKPKPAPTELRPMRAAPGTGERQRPSAATPAAKPAEAEPQTLKFPGREGAAAAVRAIVDAIALVTRVADLDVIGRALDDRRRRLARKA
jgi:ParB/RepB/Spo0J family partition protein